MMGGRNIKIGYATSTTGPDSSSDRRGSTSSKTSRQSSRTSADLPEPFPSPRIPALGGRHRLPNVPPARYIRNMRQQAKVKSVMSGDTLILSSIENPDRERTLSLAYCTSPHLKREGDEQFAFHSRDALRKLAVGKTVQFLVLYAIPNTKREYGIVFLPDGRQLPEEMVRDGWLKLREDAGRKEDSEDALQQLDKLRLFEATARSEDKGLWASSGGHVELQHDMGNSQAFLDSWKGKTVDGIVERVFSGDRMLVRLTISETKHIQVAGVRSPNTERVNPTNQKVSPAEELGYEAQRFVEERLLQRNVKVDILGLSPQNQLIATIKHPRGSIAIFLLEAGLARCTDFHSTLLGADMQPLREAEKAAQAGKKGLHKDHVAKVTGTGGNLEARVTKVFSADTIYVQNKAGVEKRINMSSVRGPRPSEPTEAPFRDEAKEFLRKRLIGKHVRMSIDGSRAATEEYDSKEVATIISAEKNIGLLLVQEGWCSVIRHRRDDTDRAPNYDELLSAQEVAKEQKKGMWSGKPQKAKEYVNASETVQKAKLQLSTLQRQKKVPAIVDFVKGGARFTILVPRENIKMNFVLGGINAPKSARDDKDKSEPFGQEAHDLATKRLTQRDVEIDVHDMDKVGGFIGELFINKESFAKILVEEGFATVREYSAQKAGNAAELLAAQDRAKEGRKGRWADWDPSQDAEEDETLPTNGSNGDAPITREKDYRDIMITNVDEAGKLKLQIIGTGTAALETMMSQFKSFHMNSMNKSALDGPPKTGEYVAAKFTEDGQWYRARVRANDRTAKVAEVLYVDYGNGEKIPWSRLRKLDQPQFTPQKLRPQAVDAIFSLLQFPVNADYLQDAVQYIQQVAMNKELVANVDFTDPRDGTLHVTVYDPAVSEKLTDSINTEIVREGHAMVPKKLKAWERGFSDVLKTLRDNQAEAQGEHLGIWEYGDLTEDD